MRDARIITPGRARLLAARMSEFPRHGYVRGWVHLISARRSPPPPQGSKAARRHRAGRGQVKQAAALQHPRIAAEADVPDRAGWASCGPQLIDAEGLD